MPPTAPAISATFLNSVPRPGANVFYMDSKGNVTQFFGIRFACPGLESCCCSSVSQALRAIHSSHSSYTSEECTQGTGVATNCKLNTSNVFTAPMTWYVAHSVCEFEALACIFKAYCDDNFSCLDDYFILFQLSCWIFLLVLMNISIVFMTTKP